MSIDHVIILMVCAIIVSMVTIPSDSFMPLATAVGVSVSVTFVVSFSLGVLVASVLGYISRRSTGTSHKPSSHDDPATVHDEVGTNMTIKGAVMEIDTNTAYGSASELYI